jgi:hypothetical protein
MNARKQVRSEGSPRFKSAPLRQRVSGLRHSPGMAAKSTRVGAMRSPHRHRRESKCRVMPHNFDFLSVGEEFGADARATECSERSSASTI